MRQHNKIHLQFRDPIFSSTVMVSIMHSVKTVEHTHNMKFCSVLSRVAVQEGGAAALTGCPCSK